MKTMPIKVYFVSDGNRVREQTGVLPMIVMNHDIQLVERTIGPMERMDRGVKWSPVREVLATHGAFHG